jgi:tryptophan synthase beta subunit
MSSTLHSATFAPGRFGPYGGRYVPETLMVPLFELERAYEAAKTDAKFQAEFADLLRNFAGRPTPLQFASRLSSHLGGPRIYLKREEECLAACTGAPMMMVDHVYHEHLTPESIDKILDELK